MHLLEGLREALVLLGNLKHQLLVLAVLLLHLCHILLECLNQVQIVVRDVVVVVLDVRKRLHTSKSGKLVTLILASKDKSKQRKTGTYA